MTWTKPFNLVLVLSLVAGILVGVAAPALGATTFTVDVASDEGDAVLADGLCLTSGGDCTLRAALQQANSTAGADTIEFDISPLSAIAPTTPLPTITEGVVIDGTTQPGAVSSPILELDGSATPGGTNGLVVSGSGSIVRGLVINDFGGSGISITAGVSSVQIESNYIGTNVAGTAAQGNGGAGISIAGPNNVVGGSTGQEGNLIGGNGSHGVSISGAGATGNLVTGNLLGLDVADGDIGNIFSGVAINGASNNTVGGIVPEARNVIAGNGRHGVELISGAATNLISGNYIGTTAGGTTSRGNDQAGVWIDSSMNNTIGGSPDGVNLISGNGSRGVVVSGSGSVGNLIQSNLIGTNNVGGGPALPNSQGGVLIQNGASSNTVGGSSNAARNVISGNSGSGLALSGATTSGNVVSSNYVGIDVSGTLAMPNSTSGVLITGAPNNTIGGDTVAERNVISRNTGNGIVISQSTASGNVISGNYIGVSPDGSSGMGNSSLGIFVASAVGNRIGGTIAAEANVISANGGGGIQFNGGADNILWGNTIGPDATGLADLTSSGPGVSVAGTNGSLIGGPDMGKGNLISGNNGGISVTSGTGTTIQGNFIGTNAGGLGSLSNSLYGIALSEAPDTLVGGASASAGNVIAYNGGEGVTVAGNSLRVAIRRNSIQYNNAWGIDLVANGASGVTLNDAGDSDAGPNQLQNFPVLTEAKTAGGTTTATGTLDTDETNAAYEIDFFASPACDALGYGEGEVYVGTGTTNTDGTGHAEISFVLSSEVAPGSALTATATDSEGNTSEFSQCLTVTLPDADLSITTDGPSTATATQNGTYTFSVTNLGPDDASDVVVTSPLPSSVTYVSADPGCSYDDPTRTVTCDIGDLVVSGSAQRELVVTANLPGTLINTASVSTTAVDPVGANNQDSHSVNVKCTITGNGKNNKLKGTAGVDVICGGGGNDTITGLGGNDLLYGGPGKDTLKGDGGNDRLFGEAGNDKLYGASGSDALRGGGGNDLLQGGAGNDSLIGEAGTDTGNFADSRKGVKANLTTGRSTGNGTDTMGTIECLVGSAKADILTGSSGANRLTGGKGKDKILGMGGNDTLHARDRLRDSVDGGKGRDRLQRDGVDSVKAVERFF